MLKLEFQNSNGEILSLTDNPYFTLQNIDGQTTAKADISSVVIGDIDGDNVNNVRAQPRTIILDLRIKDTTDVEEAKRAILNLVKIKQSGSLILTQNGRTTVISGIVEAVEMPRWQKGVAMQITMHCEQPFWEDIDFIIGRINEVFDMHYFTDDPTDMLYFPEDGIPIGEYDFSRTRSFDNAGDVSVGIEIEIIAHDTVTNPIIYDQNGNFFGVGYGTGAKQVVMSIGDVVHINTSKGKKSVTLNGVSIFDKIKPSSTWLQLGAGRNRYTINSDDEQEDNMTFLLIYKQKYI